MRFSTSREARALIAVLALVGGMAACEEPVPRAPAGPPTPETLRLLRDARADAAAGRLADALALYERALEARPGMVDVRAAAAEIARRTGSNETAVQHAELVLEELPDQEDARITLARALAPTSNRRAANVLEPALSGPDPSGSASVAAAEIALEAGDVSRAMTHLRDALRTDPSPRLLLDIGRGLSRAGFHDEAIATIRAALEAGERTANARYTLGWALENAERYPECVREYRAVLEEHPDCLPACRNLGALMARDGELPRAVKLWERGLEYHPDDPGLRSNLDEALRVLGLAREGGEG